MVSPEYLKMLNQNHPIIEIITVGSELVSWLKEETNSRHITEKLKCAGISVNYRTVVGDDTAAMEEVFKSALFRSDIIFITGGLGPTLDDITREVACTLTGREIKIHGDSLENIRKRYREKNIAWTESASRQSMVIDGALVLPNDVGCAPGMILEHQGKMMIFLPGVPAELRYMYDQYVHQKVLQDVNPCIPLRRTLKVTGLPEAKANDIIKPLLPPDSCVNILFTVGQAELCIVLEVDGRIPGAASERIKQ
jgi:nicotinamide-nucleotide amidase